MAYVTEDPRRHRVGQPGERIMTRGAFTRGPCKLTRLDHESGRIEIWIEPDDATEWGNHDGEISSCNTFQANEIDIANGNLFVASLNAATAAEDMGYDGLEAVKSLPGLLGVVGSLLEFIKAYDMEDELEAGEGGNGPVVQAHAVLAACRTKEGSGVAEDEYARAKAAESALDELAKLERVNAALLGALEVQETYWRHENPPPFGHDCQWCWKCEQRVIDMRQDAIRLANQEENHDARRVHQGAVDYGRMGACKSPGRRRRLLLWPHNNGEQRQRRK